ncbi:uncharacterized protein [Bos taurus]|uniref:uncharacterized protein n=1 Tax=Bos taurus TaxID=9913 RepID=UPI0028CBBB9D|nr:uncharacterized protein LOC112449552 [Bos taurus]
MDIKELKRGKVIKMVLKLYSLYYDPDTTKYRTGSGGLRNGSKLQIREMAHNNGSTYPTTSTQLYCLLTAGGVALPSATRPPEASGPGNTGPAQPLSSRGPQRCPAGRQQAGLAPRPRPALRRTSRSSGGPRAGEVARAARRARQVAHAGSAEPGLPRTVWSGLSRPGPLGSGRRAPLPGSRGPQDAPASAPARGRAGGRPGSVALPALRGSSLRPPLGRRCQLPRAPHLSAPPTSARSLPTSPRSPPTSTRSPPQRAPYLSALPTYLNPLPTSARSLPTSARSPPTSTRSPPQRAPYLTALPTSARFLPTSARSPPMRAPYLSAIPSSARSLPQPARARCPGRVNSDPASPQLSVSTHSARRTHVTPSRKQWLLAGLCAGRGPRVLARRREGLGCRRSRK